MQKIIPHLWFNKEAEDAATFYTSVFNGGAIHSTVRYPEAGKEIHGMDAGSVMTVEFEIEGYRFVALNGGPHFTLNPAISFMVGCPTKEKVDELWEKLSEGGTALMPLDTYPFSERFGWIKDKFGVTWQISVVEEVPDVNIIPSLLFVGDKAGKAEEAIQHYTSVFKDGCIGTVARYGANQAPDKEGTIMYADFTLAGQKFAAMDSAHEHQFTFNEAISLMVTCATQEEIDYYWEKLSAVPQAEQCGWLKDAYGVSWQIIPEGMDALLNNPDKEAANRAMNAMLQMKKIDIAAIERALRGE
ncbi:MAG TPA: VOC family protein [Candidatus Paceibacterota bacterium]|nr:VOC family protein [Candidatus Paceibacterota bacterium]